MATAVKQIKIKRGLDLPVMGAPQQRIEPARPIRTVALLGSDYPGIKPRLVIEQGDRVKLGQPLFFSKKRPSILFTSPGCGVVTKIERGPKRTLRSIVITLEGDEEINLEAHREVDATKLTGESIRAGLLTSGLWTALRARPFNRVADPRQTPFALFVTAMDTNPLSANAGVIIAGAKEAFTHGLQVVSRLSEGKVYVCTAPDENLPLPAVDNIQVVTFAGPHPAGLVGTHIHFLAPVAAGRSVWHIGYQDVIAIGHLFLSGHLNPERVISLAGPALYNPRLLRTRMGANTGDLVEQELQPISCRVISGSILSGHHAAGWASYLGRYHNQISVLPDNHQRELLGWLSPGLNKFSASRVLLSSLFKRNAYWMTTAENGSPRAMVPIGAYERVMPLDILPTQLLRALLISDTETARGLGALELDEEDLALCTYVCPCKYNYGPILQRTLRLIEREG